MSVLIHSARVVSAGREDADGWVLLTPAGVGARGTGGTWRSVAADVVIDAVDAAGPGALLTPGFIDLHGHGGAGWSYDDGPEAIRAARAMHRAHGTTRAVLSLVTAPLDETAQRAALVAEMTRAGEGVLGSHLEGPFLDAAHKGAHASALLQPPSPEAIERLIEAGAGTVRQVTLAPDVPGGLDAIRQVVAAGVVAAVGHTGADRDLAAAAFDAGATVLTHAFNAMPGLHHRAPGPVGAALADDRVVLELIADGVHLHPDIVRLCAAAAPGRIALVTDAMAAAGAADGDYTIGALAVAVRDGVARLAATDTIAGSTLTQDAALRMAVAAGVALPAAVDALTRTPARVLGRTDLGRLEGGAVADAVLLRADLGVARVWVEGRAV